eukprot:6717711-Pyramimonas_sp.AAC.1
MPREARREAIFHVAVRFVLFCSGKQSNTRTSALASRTVAFLGRTSHIGGVGSAASLSSHLTLDGDLGFLASSTAHLTLDGDLAFAASVHLTPDGKGGPPAPACKPRRKNGTPVSKVAKPSTVSASKRKRPRRGA